MEPPGTKERLPAQMHRTGSHSSVPVGAVQFHRQNYPQLHHSAQLENTLNFYAVRPVLYADKFSINLVVQKLLVKC
jgi:hypothetical protein